MLLCMVGIYMFCNSKVFQGRRCLGLQYRDLGYGPSLTWQSWLVPTSSSWTSSMMMGRQRRETSRWGPLLSRGPSVRWRPLAKTKKSSNIWSFRAGGQLFSTSLPLDTFQLLSFGSVLGVMNVRPGSKRGNLAYGRLCNKILHRSYVTLYILHQTHYRQSRYFTRYLKCVCNVSFKEEKTDKSLYKNSIKY